MNRRKLTPEQMAAKVAKMKATKAANKAKALAEFGLQSERKKVRKSRKPMTDEQKNAARERLAKARAAKQKKSPAVPKNVHPKVVAMPDESLFSLRNVREWIKYNKELRSEERRAIRSNVKGADARVASIDGYIRNMEHYIRTGDWIDNFYGKDQNNKIRWKVWAMGYHFEGPFKGMIKREVGVLYPDVGVWTQEMHDDYYGVQVVERKPKTRKRRRK